MGRRDSPEAGSRRRRLLICINYASDARRSDQSGACIREDTVYNWVRGHRIDINTLDVKRSNDVRGFKWRSKGWSHPPWGRQYGGLNENWNWETKPEYPNGPPSSLNLLGNASEQPKRKLGKMPQGFWQCKRLKWDHNQNMAPQLFQLSDGIHTNKTLTKTPRTKAKGLYGRVGYLNK